MKYNDAIYESLYEIVCNQATNFTLSEILHKFNLQYIGYYKYLEKRKRKIKKNDEEMIIVQEIRLLKAEKAFKYAGYRPITMKLCEKYKINHKRVLRLTKKYNLLSKIRQKKPYRSISKFGDEHKIFPNTLNRKFEHSIPEDIILTDITYLLPDANKKFYLSAAKDLATGEIVAWNVQSDMHTHLSTEILKELDIKGFKNYLIHSDQGVHYTCSTFVKLAKQYGVTQSMSRKGMCTDNGPMESFFGHFKDEVDYMNVKTLEEMQDIVSEYMIYYNQQRRQWHKKKMTPIEYRHHLLTA